MNPPYKDKMGRWRSRSLFLEFAHPTLEPVFTLQENHGDLPSARALFLKYEDPTGYLFAKEYLGSYEHWRKLCETSWFKGELNSWLEELETKLESGALKKIKETAEGEGAQALSAAKFLATKGWTPKRGRPKKEEVQRAAAVAAGVESAVEDDLERIRLVK